MRTASNDERNPDVLNKKSALKLAFSNIVELTRVKHFVLKNYFKNEFFANIFFLVKIKF
jgi:hypothetical protein